MSALPNVSIMHSLDGFPADARIMLHVGDTVIVLDTICPVCRGQNKEQCKKCRGLGTVPSPEGARILGFVNKYLFREPTLAPQQPAGTP